MADQTVTDEDLRRVSIEVARTAPYASGDVFLALRRLVAAGVSLDAAAAAVTEIGPSGCLVLVAMAGRVRG
jgi:hypothetical protein